MTARRWPENILLPNNCLITVPLVMSMPRWSKGSVPDSYARGPQFDPPSRQVTTAEFLKNLIQ